jgi:DNA gyrase subunit B
VDEATKNKEIIRNRLNVKYSQDKYKLDLVLTYTDSNSATIVPYVNTGVTDSGPHITQIKTTVTREMNKFFKSRGWLKDKDSNLSGDEVQDGIYILFNITAPDVKYDAQVKSRVTQINMTPLNAALSDSLQDWLELNEIEIKKIFDKATLAKKAKEAAKKAKDKILKPKDTTKKSLKEKLAMSDKFIDCSSKNPNERELMVVEGLSAGSACVEARNPKTQAIMMLRGKVINALKSPVDRVLANQEYHDLIESIGAGFGNTFDINKCKFDKILIATDAK